MKADLTAPIVALSGTAGGLTLAQWNLLAGLAVTLLSGAYLVRRWVLLERSRRAACAGCPKRAGLVFPKDG